MAEKKEKKKKTIGTMFLIGTFFMVLLSVAFLKCCVLDFFRIPTNSMLPVLDAGDYVLVSRVKYFIGLPPFWPVINEKNSLDWRLKYKDIKKHDIVAFKFPIKNHGLGKDRYLTKRVSRLPGETVVIDSNFVKIPYNSYSIELDSLNYEMYKVMIEKDGNRTKKIKNNFFINGYPAESYTFRQNFYFVTGDNPKSSYDSRYWGMLPEENIIGSPLFIYWSQDSSGINFDRIFKWVY